MTRRTIQADELPGAKMTATPISSWRLHIRRRSCPPVTLIAPALSKQRAETPGSPVEGKEQEEEAEEQHERTS
jgi:hypothetical protein